MTFVSIIISVVLVAVFQPQHTVVTVAAANTEVNAGALDAALACNQELDDLEFVFLEDDAVVRSIEDNIRADLATLGLTVEARPLAKADLNTARQSGDFHISISETCTCLSCSCCNFFFFFSISCFDDCMNYSLTYSLTHSLDTYYYYALLFLIRIHTYTYLNIHIHAHNT
mmetsp:Transcript_34446/g.37203  ORF Transcript_34446/g.37203 Transcript_34446/m.37203 type:complete len:171 (+) Transcript_34446:154-666(+)